MGIKLYSTEAVAYIERLARERDEGGGLNRLLDHGLIHLDSVQAWAGTSNHILNGSKVEAVYFEGHDSDEAQVAQALPATQAGVDRCRIIGKLIDLRMTQAGSGLCLCTSGLRLTPFRAISTRVGTLVAIAFDCSLGVTVREACAIAGVAYPYDTPRTATPQPNTVAADAVVPAPEGTVRVRQPKGR